MCSVLPAWETFWSLVTVMTIMCDMFVKRFCSSKLDLKRLKLNRFSSNSQKESIRFHLMPFHWDIYSFLHSMGWDSMGPLGAWKPFPSYQEGCCFGDSSFTCWLIKCTLCNYILHILPFDCCSLFMFLTLFYPIWRMMKIFQTTSASQGESTEVKLATQLVFLFAISPLMTCGLQMPVARWQEFLPISFLCSFGQQYSRKLVFIGNKLLWIVRCKCHWVWLRFIRYIIKNVYTGKNICTTKL